MKPQAKKKKWKSAPTSHKETIWNVAKLWWKHQRMFSGNSYHDSTHALIDIEIYEIVYI